jgi:hypothetical protein
LAAETGPNFRNGIDSGGLERAYYEIGRDHPTPAVTLQALMYSLRRGVNELIKPDTLRRFSALAEDQLEAVWLPTPFL